MPYLLYTVLCAFYLVNANPIAKLTQNLSSYGYSFPSSPPKWSNPVIIPFAVDTQGNFCFVALLFLKSIAKLKFKNMPGDSRLKDRAQSDWVSETCRNIQVQVIKTSAFNNRLALKDSFGMDYSKLFPGSIFNPPSYSENFISSSSGRWPIYLF